MWSQSYNTSYRHITIPTSASGAGTCVVTPATSPATGASIPSLTTGAARASSTHSPRATSAATAPAERISRTCTARRARTCAGSPAGYYIGSVDSASSASAAVGVVAAAAPITTAAAAAAGRRCGRGAVVEAVTRQRILVVGTSLTT